MTEVNAKEVKLPTGATLKITLAPFADSKALYQAVLEEAKAIQVSAFTDMSSVIKDSICIGLSSKKIEACLHECLKRCTYNSGSGDFKVDKDTFEPEKNRDDYIAVCIEVAKANILPFVKSLSVQYEHVLTMIVGDRK